MLQRTEASCPPWTLRALPPVLWQAGTRFDVPLVHLGTRVIALAGQERLCMGQTVWAGPCGRDAGAGVAWDWVQLKPEVVAMADPDKAMMAKAQALVKKYGKAAPVE